MILEDILFTQGFGTRHDCRALARSGLVEIGGEVRDDPDEDFETDGLVFVVRGESWPYCEKAILALHKPAGYECSLKPSAHPSVMTLLPAPLRRRGVQPVGRLDVDTTGVLLFTDDGRLLHRLIHPKRHVSKTYTVVIDTPLTEEMKAGFATGVTLADGTALSPAEVSALTPDGLTVRVLLRQGVYHQIKRMFGVYDAGVNTLHRLSIGGVALDETLAPGEYRELTEEERKQLQN